MSKYSERIDYPFRGSNWVRVDGVIRYKKTGSIYDKEGYTYDGFDKYGYNRARMDIDGNSVFDENGICKITKTEYDITGYDKNGYDKDGYDKDGYDKNGYNKNNFDRYNIYKETGTKYDKDGYDVNGYDKQGYNKEGFYKKKGQRKNRITKTEYDVEGYDEEGYNEKGYNRRDFSRDGIHFKTKTKYDENGYDKDGFDKDGFDKDGINKNGKNAEEVKKTKDQQRKIFLGLLDVAEKLGTGQMSTEEYMIRSGYDISQLIVFAKKQKMSANIIRGLYGKQKEYKQYAKKFNQKDYLEHTILIIDGEDVRPQEDDVEKCLIYLKENKRYICDKTVRETVSSYKRGDLIIEDKDEKKETIQHIKELQVEEEELDLKIAEEKVKNNTQDQK